jgi:DNA-binding transcriptional LysR family regulator
MDNRYTTETGDEFRFHFWLTFSKDGSMNMTRGEPRLGRGERAMNLTVTLAKAIFSPPALEAKITFPAGAAQEFRIDAEAVAQAIRGVVGAEVDLVVHPGPSEVDEALAARRLEDQP